MAEPHLLENVYPIGSRINELGRLEVGGCDVVELAREFGTPAYIVSEADMRARARGLQAAFAAESAQQNRNGLGHVNLSSRLQRAHQPCAQ